MDGRSFALGMIAGGVLLGAGMLLGASGTTTSRDGARLAEFDTITARRLDIVRPNGEVVVRLRAGKDGGLVRVMDRGENLRAEINGSGNIAVFGDQGESLVRVGPVESGRGWSGVATGELLLFDQNGSVVGRLPGWVDAPASPAPSSAHATALRSTDDWRHAWRERWGSGLLTDRDERSLTSR